MRVADSRAATAGSQKTLENPRKPDVESGPSAASTHNPPTDALLPAPPDEPTGSLLPRAALHRGVAKPQPPDKKGVTPMPIPRTENELMVEPTGSLLPRAALHRGVAKPQPPDKKGVTPMPIPRTENELMVWAWVSLLFYRAVEVLRR